MSKLCKIVFCWHLVIIPFVTSGQVTNNSSQIKGKVVASTGIDLAGVKIFFKDGEGHIFECETDSLGNYQILLPPEKYSITTKTQNYYLPDRALVKVSASQKLTISLYLEFEYAMIYNDDSPNKSSKTKLAVGKYPLKCTSVWIKSKNKTSYTLATCSERAKLYPNRKQYSDVLITYDSYTFRGNSATVLPEKSLIILEGNVNIEDGVNSYSGKSATITFDSANPKIIIN